MYEDYYGLSETPFSPAPDPKFLCRSGPHANAFDALQRAVDRRGGFVVVTGAVGSGKTTLCQALVEQIDRHTFTSLVLNPLLTAEDLLQSILQDFGVMSRDRLKSGCPSGVTRQEMVDALHRFLLGLVPLNASALLIVDEAQVLPSCVLEQIRILSNLETGKGKLLQIMLVGQLSLETLLKSPDLRPLGECVSIRYEIEPLDQESVAAYVAHRLAVAGGAAAVVFTPEALVLVQRWTGGVPSRINRICHRALLAGFSLGATRITPEMVRHAAKSLDLETTALPGVTWLTERGPLAAGVAVVLLGSTFAVGTSALLYQRLGMDGLEASTRPPMSEAARPAVVRPPEDIRLPGSPHGRRLPGDAGLTILVGSYPLATGDAEIRTLTAWLESTGYRVYYATIDLGADGLWQRILAGAYTDAKVAEAERARMSAAAPALRARIVTTDKALEATIQ